MMTRKIKWLLLLVAEAAIQHVAVAGQLYQSLPARIEETHGVEIAPGR